MLTDLELQYIARPMMNGNSFNNMDAAIEYGKRVIAAYIKSQQESVPRERLSDVYGDMDGLRSRD